MLKFVFIKIVNEMVYIRLSIILFSIIQIINEFLYLFQ
jgi:hypothetical protein